MPPADLSNRVELAIKDEVIRQRFSVPFAFDVHFTHGLFNPLNPLFKEVLNARDNSSAHRVLIFVDAGVNAAMPALRNTIQGYANANSRSIELVCEPTVFAAGEAIKSDPEALIELQKIVASHALDRHSFIVAIGGGALLDTVGLVAATAHRGIRHIRIPTTVLAQNDSGVGVKNGVNQFGQKNYLGTFCPPFAVINDYAFIEVLPDRDKIAGMAEAIKVALIRDREFFSWLERNAERLARFDRTAMLYMIKRCAELHMHQIANGGDPFESGSARPLDFGHWAAHKLESLTDFALRHGEAVAIGIALDSRYSVQIGLLDEGREEKICRLLRTLGFGLWHSAIVSVDESNQLCLLEGLAEFREHLGGELTITLLTEIGDGVEVHSIDSSAIGRAITWLENFTNDLTETCSENTANFACDTSDNVIPLAVRNAVNLSDESTLSHQVRSSLQVVDSKQSNLPDTKAACLSLQSLLQKQLSNKQFRWLENRLEKINDESTDRDLHITMGMIPRKLGQADLVVTPAEIAAARDAAGVAWTPDGWSVDNAARCIVLGQLLAVQPNRFDIVFSELCQCAELRESIALYRCTAILPQSELTDTTVSSGLRTHIRAVFEAISHANPYPSLNFDRNRWNHMILKALFIESELWPIYGIDERANRELAIMLCDYANERWAAGRPVSPELWRCVGPYASGPMIGDMQRALESTDSRESMSGLMALLTCPDADHQSLRRRFPAHCKKIDDGFMNWEKLGKEINDVI